MVPFSHEMRCLAVAGGAVPTSHATSHATSRQAATGVRMEIRRATPDDLGQIAVLLDAAGLPPLPGNLQLANVLVALGGGAVVGVIALEVRGLRGLLRTVAVEPGHARQGVGTSLFQSLLARAQELSLRELYLLTQRGVEFFDKVGFVAVSRDSVPADIRSTREYREDCPESAAVMRLRLVTRHV